ncbi:MAG: DUF2809 domain-containing protein [Gemmatimonadota bacterium]|nr:DUF2809 domain-containing protein [Gemmatimonadota bacterium]
MRERHRGVVALLILVTGALGLASRCYPTAMPAFVATYAGDTLWAALVFWCLALLFRRQATARLAIVTVVIAFAVEGSQLYHAPWIDTLRDTLPGRLVLGSGFLWSDLVCHVVGAGMAAALDTAMAHRRSAPVGGIP